MFCNRKRRIGTYHSPCRVWKEIRRPGRGLAWRASSAVCTNSFADACQLRDESGHRGAAATPATGCTGGAVSCSAHTLSARSEREISALAEHLVFEYFLGDTWDTRAARSARPRSSPRIRSRPHWRPLRSTTRRSDRRPCASSRLARSSMRSAHSLVGLSCLSIVRAASPWWSPRTAAGRAEWRPGDGTGSPPPPRWRPTSHCAPKCWTAPWESRRADRLEHRAAGSPRSRSPERSPWWSGRASRPDTLDRGNRRGPLSARSGSGRWSETAVSCRNTAGRRRCCGLWKSETARSQCRARFASRSNSWHTCTSAAASRCPRWRRSSGTSPGTRCSGTPDCTGISTPPPRWPDSPPSRCCSRCWLCSAASRTARWLWTGSSRSCRGSGCESPPSSRGWCGGLPRRAPIAAETWKSHSRWASTGRTGWMHRNRMCSSTVGRPRAETTEWETSIWLKFSNLPARIGGKSNFAKRKSRESTESVSKEEREKIDSFDYLLNETMQRIRCTARITRC